MSAFPSIRPLILSIMVCPGQVWEGPVYAESSVEPSLPFGRLINATVVVRQLEVGSRRVSAHICMDTWTSHFDVGTVPVVKYSV